MLAAKIAVDEARAHAGLLGHRGHAGAVEAVADKAAAGRIQDAAALLFGAVAVGGVHQPASRQPPPSALYRLTLLLCSASSALISDCSAWYRVRWASSSTR